MQASITSPLVIPAAAFSDDGFWPDSFFFTFGGGYVMGDDGANYGCLKAPAYLPNGVTVTDIYATVYDNDATYEAYVDLWRVDNFSGGTDLMAEPSSSGTFGDIQVILDSTIDVPLIVYPAYSYYVTTCLQASQTALYSVRIYYDLPRPDLVVSYLAAQITGTRSLNATYRVMNQGSGDAVASTLRFYLSTDAVLSGDDVPAGSVSIPSLAPGQEAPVPYGTLTGPRIRDIPILSELLTLQGTNNESDEGNNVTAVPIL